MYEHMVLLGHDGDPRIMRSRIEQVRSMCPDAAVGILAASGASVTAMRDVMILSGSAVRILSQVVDMADRVTILPQGYVPDVGTLRSAGAGPNESTIFLPRVGPANPWAMANMKSAELAATLPELPDNGSRAVATYIAAWCASSYTVAGIDMSPIGDPLAAAGFGPDIEFMPAEVVDSRRRSWAGWVEQSASASSSYIESEFSDAVQAMQAAWALHCKGLMALPYTYAYDVNNRKLLPGKDVQHVGRFQWCFYSKPVSEAVPDAEDAVGAGSTRNAECASTSTGACSCEDGQGSCGDACTCNTKSCD